MPSRFFFISRPSAFHANAPMRFTTIPTRSTSSARIGQGGESRPHEAATKGYEGLGCRIEEKQQPESF